MDITVGCMLYMPPCLYRLHKLHVVLVRTQIMEIPETQSLLHVV